MMPRKSRRKGTCDPRAQMTLGDTRHTTHTSCCPRLAQPHPTAPHSLLGLLTISARSTEKLLKEILQEALKDRFILTPQVSGWFMPWSGRACAQEVFIPA